MLKEQLLEEAQNIDVSVDLDSVFESVDLSDQVKENFSTVFEASVKSNAVKLAEAHIQKIAEEADAKVETAVNERATEFEAKLSEEVKTYLEHIGSEWLAENKLQITSDIKSRMFESLFTGVKDLVIEHNVSIPEESVDVVAEMDIALEENKQEANRLFEENVKLKKEISAMERSKQIAESTQDLTESQVEKVTSLTEGMKYDAGFSAKLNAIVEMVKGSSKEEAIKESDINTTENNPNFEVIKETEDKKPEELDSYMSAYAKAL